MNPGRATTRQLATCLLLSAVLILGIVQWSFLPVLIQDSSFSGRTAVDVSPGHSSKFAAPSKFLLGNFVQPRLKQVTFAVPPPLVSFSRRPEEPIFNQDDQFFIYRQLRSPPSS